MQNFKIFTFLLLVSFSLSSCLDMFTSGVEGSGIVSKKAYNFSGFSKISIATGINAMVTIGKEESITVEADDNLLELIEVKVSGDELSVSLKKNVSNYKQLNVYITAKEIDGLTASSAANISVDSLIRTEKLVCRASSAAKINFSAKADQIEANTSSSGQINMDNLVAQTARFETSSGASISVTKGTTIDLFANASSGSRFSASGLESQNCDAQASSGSTMNVYVLKKLSADASSGGGVYYKGSPNVERMKTSSGGNVSKD
jgi:hypothetical protein